MRRLWISLVVLAILTGSGWAIAASRDRSKEEDDLKKQQRLEWMRFYRQDPSQTKEIPQTSMSIEFYNHAVQYYRDHEFDLAKQALLDSIRLSKRNPHAYELLGDIAQAQHELDKAKEYYKQAYLLKRSDELQEKFEKVSREIKLDDQFRTHETEHFIVKYQGDQPEDLDRIVGILNEAYDYLAKSFGHSFRRPVVVLLYHHDEFREITKLPHWVSGVYDGKVRMPAYRKGLLEFNLEAIAVHEMTHAFIAEMSRRKAPSWLNEGLAVHHELNFDKRPMIVFNAAVRTNTLLSLDQLMNEAKLMKEKDPLFVNLFYEQSSELVKYLIDKFGMFKIKEMLKQFSASKNYDETIRSVLKTSVENLEAEWRATLATS